MLLSENILLCAKLVLAIILRPTLPHFVESFRQWSLPLFAKLQPPIVS